MNIKHASCIILLFILLFSTMTVISADDDKSYSIKDALVELTVENNGLLHVDEIYNYTFKGSYNGVYRDIPLKQGESIDNIKVSAIGAYPVLKEIDKDGEKQLKIYLYADKHHTKKIKDTEVTVFISYDMKNVVTLFNDVGAIQYKLWGEEWDVGVESLNAIIHLPGDKNNTYFLTPEEYDKKSTINGNTITTKSNSISNGEYYELLALMPLSDFDNAEYAKHVNENGKEQILKNHEDSINERNFWNTSFMILAILSLISPLAAIFIYIKYGREPKVTYNGIYEREPPSDDPPAMVNALIDNKYIGTPNMKGFEATILDLINRKLIKLDVKESKSNTKDLYLDLSNADDNLDDNEKIILNTMSRFANNNILNLSQLNSKLSSETNAKWFMEQYRLWQNNIMSEYTNKENISIYFNNKGTKIIKGVVIISLIYGIAITGLGIVTSLNSGLYSIIGGIFLIIFSVSLLFIPDDIFGQWTVNGREYYLKWKNFKKFLKDNSLIKEHPPESIVIWNKYLIYGTALGVADNVYNAMKLQEKNIPDYDNDIYLYHTYGGYHIMHHALSTGQNTASSSSDTSDFGSVGGGSGGGGGGAF